MNLFVPDQKPAYATLTETLSQPETWRATLALLNDRASDLRAYLDDLRADHVIYMGCGSPYYLARSAALTSREVTGLSSEAHPGSDMWLFPETVLNPERRSLLVVASRSGETTEVLQAVETFERETRGGVVAVTCYGDSTLAQRAPFSIALPHAQEISLAQTRSFTSMLLSTQFVAHALGGKPLAPAMLQLPDLCADLLDANSDFARDFGTSLHDHFERFFFLGSGSLYGIALEANLKMKEMSLSLSEAYHTLEFRHGPKAMIHDKSLVIGLVSERAAALEADVLAEMRQMGAKVLAITPVPLSPHAADYQVLLPDGLSDSERAALYLPVWHVIAYYHTVRKGLDPDNPQNLSAFVNIALSNDGQDPR